MRRGTNLKDGGAVKWTPSLPTSACGGVALKRSILPIRTSKSRSSTDPDSTVSSIAVIKSSSECKSAICSRCGRPIPATNSVGFIIAAPRRTAMSRRLPSVLKVRRRSLSITSRSSSLLRPSESRSSKLSCEKDDLGRYSIFKASWISGICSSAV